MFDTITLISIAIAFVVLISVHEYAHAWMADRLGDPTARYEGRLTLNPLVHLDPMGTLLPAMLILANVGFVFGWGKPTPFNPANFRNPRRDSALVALAGPVSNLLVAFIVSFPIRYLGDPLFVLFRTIFVLSIVLMVFNLLPIPPLDGSKIIGFFVPDRYHYQYELFLYNGSRYFLIFILVDFLLLKNIFGYSVIQNTVGGLTELIAGWILLGA